MMKTKILLEYFNSSITVSYPLKEIKEQRSNFLYAFFFKSLNLQLIFRGNIYTHTHTYKPH